MIADRYSAHRCRVCHTPLVELLSDAVGRLFGCERCRTVNGANALPPAVVTSVVHLFPRERRRQARRWTKGRRGARRVAARTEETLPHPERYAVLRAEMFRGHGALVRDLGDGWALGVIPSGPRMLQEYRFAPVPARWDVASAVATTAETVTIELVRVGGVACGVADKQAPWPVVARAFNRLADERLHRVTLPFLESLR